MAKKKARPNAKNQAESVVSVRSSAEWKAWAEELANLCRTDTSKLIDMALVDFAKSRGFKKEAPRR